MKERGVTILEVLIASVVLSAVMGITFQLLMSTQSVQNEANIAQNLDDRCRNFIDFYKMETMFCKATLIATDGSSIQYQVPVGQDLSGALTYGYNSTLDYKAELLFSPRILYTEDNAGSPPTPPGATAQSMNGIDLNSDGDLNDAFLHGRILKNVYNAGGILVDSTIASDNVLVAYDGSSMDLDLDSDGTADPLFTVLDLSGTEVPSASISASGVKLRMDVWHGAFSELKTRFVIRHLQDEWNFKNSQ